MSKAEPEQAPAAVRQYGTFAGVFTPTLLTILGVIMYLRLPWVVGNGGLAGGLAVIALAIGITVATGLSLSSIATNTRLGAGGPYAIIAKSLGLEIGGSVGVPLYLSQALAVAMYVFGFREGWTWIFPHHPALAVDLATFVVVFGIALVSAGLAFRIQYLVIVIIAGSLVVVLANADVWGSDVQLTWWGSYGAIKGGRAGTDFWKVFAVFFPAATGILAGANMSGELSNPRKSIPLGTLSAIAISAAVYVALAVWSAKAGTAEQLTRNYNIMIDRSLYSPLVLAGVLGATFSSALSSLVGAPRILLALASDRLIPYADTFVRVSRGGEPRRGTLLTGAIVLLALMARDLNVIAPLITMFFLITYAVINIVMLVESSLGLVSFRPTLRFPRVVPLIGAGGCLFTMFIVNPTFSLIAWGAVVALYFWIMQRHIGRPGEDVRSGIFVAFAEWAASKVTELTLNTARAWKPSFLVPVVDGAQLRGEYRLLSDLCRASGSIKLLGIADRQGAAELTPRIRHIGQGMRKQVFTTWSVVESADFKAGVIAGLQALRSAFFRPNVLFLRAAGDERDRQEQLEVLQEARRLRVGLLLLGMHPKAGLGRASVVNLWLRPPDEGEDVARTLEHGNSNLAILCAYRLARAWGAELNLVSVVGANDQVEAMRAYVEELRDLCRIPSSARTIIEVGSLEQAVRAVPQSDMDIMGMPMDLNLEFVERMIKLTRSSCMFTMDSGRESALA